MPAGSKFALMPAIRSTASPISSRSEPRLPWPMPCSPVQVPPKASARVVDVEAHEDQVRSMQKHL